MGWHEELETALSALPSSMVHPGQQSNGPAVERLRQHATDILCRHPALEELLTTSDQWCLYSLSQGSPYNTEQLKSELFDSVLTVANKTGVEKAVRTCDKILTSAVERNLPGFELTFFFGIKLTERWDIIPGLYAIPYKSIQQQFDKRQVRLSDSIIFKLNPQDEKNLTVLVREFRWGPIIVPSSDRTVNDSWPVETILTYVHDPLSIIALLAVTLNCPLPVLAQTERAAPWVYDFLGYRGSIGTCYDQKSWRGTTEISEQNRRVSEQALTDLDSLAAADRDRLVLALTRLSTSLSRSGTLAAQDRVLDISIALEVLYQIQSELTYKLTTRAGWYLGSNTNERVQIGKTIRDFYGFRSDIVHGRKSDLAHGIHGQVFNIARDTLLKHLSSRRLPDKPYWDEVVMGDEKPSKQ